MNLRNGRWAWIGVVGLVALSLVCQAGPKAAKAPDPYAFSTRVYRCTSTEPVSGFFFDEAGQSRRLECPPADASKAKIEALLKGNDKKVQEYLASQNILLPKGSLACYDASSRTLVLRTSGMVHELVSYLVQALTIVEPAHVGWELDIIEAPATAVRAAMRECAGKWDHTTIHSHLLAAGKRVETLRGDVNPGVETKVSRGSKVAPPDESPEGEPVASNEEETNTGTSITMNARIDARHDFIEVILNLAHHDSKPIAGTAKQTGDPGIDGSNASLNTCFALASHSSRMIGAWTLDGAPEPERANAMQAAFMRASIVRDLPPENPRLEALFKAHGGTVEPASKALIPDPNAVPWSRLIIRQYPVPPDFLNPGGASEPNKPDPFAASDPKARRKTAVQAMEENGIAFPPGATACYFSATSELLVRNTQANMNMVETLSCSMTRRARELAFSLHVIQADAAWLRKLGDDSVSLPDSSHAWKTIEEAVSQGKAKMVRTMYLETKPGTEVMVENMAGVSAPRLEAPKESDPIGLHLDLQAVVQPDSKRLDVDITLSDDFAPPYNERHRISVKTSTTMLAGSTRMLSVWKPSGTPELDGDVLQAAFLHAEVIRVEPAN